MLDYGRINSEVMCNNLMNKFVWGGANDPEVNIDYHHRRTLMVVRARLNYAKLAKELASRGMNEKALAVLDRCMEVLPLETVPYDPYVVDMVEAYFAAGNTEKGADLAKSMCDHYFEQLDYYLKQRPYIVNSAEYEIISAIQYPSRAGSACTAYGKAELGAEIEKKWRSYYDRFIALQPEMRQ
jgi:hypothetical protein